MNIGLNEVLAIIICIIGILLLISEFKAKQATDLVTNIVISVLLGGVSIYNLILLGFKSSSVILTICYLISLIVTIIYICLFIFHYKKYHKNKTE